MARGILGQYGPDSSQPQKASAKCGGVRKGDPMDVDVNKYQQPYGPKNIMDPKGAGLHGQKYGNVNGPDNAGRARTGTMGLGGVVRNGGTQGSY